jgi:transmembrane 9 superfamily member 3
MWGRHRTAAALSGQPVPHTNVIPRQIPLATKSWYSTAEALALLGGILPFGSIFIELYYIFASFWGYKMYYVFGFLFLVVLMLLLVTACSAVVIMYLLLNGEDHRWQWTAFSSGASVGLYIFFFSGYYFLFKTRMSGLFMTVFYFGYSFLLSVGVALACGAIAFTAASKFVSLIYSRLRKD